MKKVLLTIILAAMATLAMAQGSTFSGVVLEKGSGKPVEFATVHVEASEQWSVTDENGRFSIKNVSIKKSRVTVASLGYVTLSREFEFPYTKEVKFQLDEDNLALDGAIITAKENANAATTARTIDKTALDHVQLMNVGDISSLLPGGVTTNNSLTSAKNFNIRAGGSSEDGNASFGTAVEVDGVRLSSNASYSGTSGVNTNNIASANVESVEVITGVPSVEYGDIGAGVVKINTRKGRTPWMITMSTSPRTKQLSASKGFSLGPKSGVINASAEYTRSVSETMSPYTSYDRKQLSLSYTNTFAQTLKFSADITGNLGGMDNRADPDLMLGTWSVGKDNALRAHIGLNWLLSKPWITNIEFNASAAYSDKFSQENSYYHSAVSGISLHARTQGYYMSAPYADGGENPVVMIDPGTWYNIMAVDDRPLTAKVTLKANWATHFGKLGSKLKIGAEWNMDENLGIGQYSEDLAKAPTYREYRYCDNPAMHNIGLYAEENLDIPVGGGHLNLVAGVRNDNTYIAGSAYGFTSSVSPRLNVRYKVNDALSFRASWGMAVKLPSFAVLYPAPTYQDLEVFTSTASADNTVYRAYYVQPRAIDYNPALKWQRNSQSEIGAEIKLLGTKISLAAFYNKTLDSYLIRSYYTGFSYNYTGTASSQGLSIPAENRVYSIDGASGIITVSDKTGALPSETVKSENRRQYISGMRPDNSGSPVSRMGIEWVAEFPRIQSIGTTIRLDGTYYSYRSIDGDTDTYTPLSTIGANGKPYGYIGYYYGGHSAANGSESRTLRNNLTITTHIPKLRLILSAKLEASLLRYSRALSDRDGAERAKVIADRTDILNWTEGASIYDGNVYGVVFPDTYESIEEPGVQYDYLEKLRWAKEHDSNLYSNLSRLAVTSNYLYIFNKDYISPYFSANFSVTKEIGDIASISFYANNFFNNRGQVYSSKTGNYSSVTSYIPAFYYGLTLRLKF